MSTRALQRPKDEDDLYGSKSRKERANFHQGDQIDRFVTETQDIRLRSSKADEDVLENKLRHYCLKSFRSYYVKDELDSNTDSDGSYIPKAMKKLMRQRKSFSSNRRTKTIVRSEREKVDRHPSKNPKSAVSRANSAKIAAKSKTRITPKEETTLQKSSPASKLDGDVGGSRRGSRPINSDEAKSNVRRSVIDILLDPTVDQKEAEKMVIQMHEAAKESRLHEVEGYLDEVQKAIHKLDADEGVAEDDDFVDLSPSLVESDEEEIEEGKMDGKAMRIMLTALAGREAKEDAVASVANVGSSWRSVPHDQLNCCLSMDPKLLDDHRRRLKNNYADFDKVFRTGKGKGTVKRNNDEENENEDASNDKLKSEKPQTHDDNAADKDDEPVNLSELTREQMLDIHYKIGPWVHHHTKKLDKFIQSKKYTPQYLLNYWNGELSDDDSEVDFEKHRSAWKKKLEDQNNPDETNQEAKPKTILPEDRVPSLQENNWFLFPTPLTRSYSKETDEQGWDGQRTRPFSQLAMEGLVKHLKRQKEVEKSKKFLKDNPWPPPSRYPPEINPEVEIKYAGSEFPAEEEEDVK